MPSTPRLGRPITWLVVWWALLLAVLSVLYPVWRSPDEPAHVDMARWAGEEIGWPQLRQRAISRQVIESQEHVGVVDRSIRTSPPLAGSAPERPSFGEVAPDEPSGVTQQMVQHPPLYYVLVGRLGALLLQDDLPFDTEVSSLRLLSALLLVPLPLLTWLAARELLPERAALVAAVLSVSSPQLAHIGAAVNNDTLLVLLIAAMTPVAVRMARGEGSLRLAVALGVLGGLAALTKGFGFFTPLWVVIACVASRTDVVRRSAAALAALFVAGGWWIVRNVLVEGAVQPSAFGYPEPPPGFAPDLRWWAGFFWGRFNGRYWFEPDAVPPGAPPVAQWLTVGLLLLMAAGFVVLWRRSAAWPAVTLAVPPVALFGLTVFGAFNYYRSVGHPWGINGRYVFPAVAAVSVLAAAAVGARRWAPAIALGVVLALHGVAAWWALQRYWADLDAVRAWAPLPWGVVVAATAALATATVGLVVTATAGTPRTPRAARR